MPSADRSQPANALVVGPDVYLVDVGDGTAGQLAKAGLSLQSLRAIFLSHLHHDHVGGLAAILGLRNQTAAPGVLMVYGPPGTQALIEGLLASMQGPAEAGYGMPGESWPPPPEGVRAVEIADGSRVQLSGLAVTAAQNTHYSYTAGSDMDRRHKSLAFRFDLTGRSIAYTGDTGPSAAVEKLAKGADLLVSEMIDVQHTMQNVARARPDLPEADRADLVAHLTQHHLTPVQVGELASRAQVRSLVITHLGAGRVAPEVQQGFLRDINRNYSGVVTVASDLDRF